jgi:predicted transcriptional regulator YdeE
MTATLNLTHTPEAVQFPETRYVFVERRGHIPAIAQQAWQAVHAFFPEIVKHNRIVGGAALYKCSPGAGTYRAGFMLAAAPVNLPEALTYVKLPAGKFVRFTLSGPYDQLPEASRRAFEIVHDEQIALRDDFNIEHYVNDPMTTPADQLITEILFPAK